MHQTVFNFSHQAKWDVIYRTWDRVIFCAKFIAPNVVHLTKARFRPKHWYIHMYLYMTYITFRRKMLSTFTWALIFMNICRKKGFSKVHVLNNLNYKFSYPWCRVHYARNLVWYVLAPTPIWAHFLDIKV